jgi:hypothetical protein
LTHCKAKISAKDQVYIDFDQRDRNFIKGDIEETPQEFENSKAQIRAAMIANRIEV